MLVTGGFCCQSLGVIPQFAFTTSALWRIHWLDTPQHSKHNTTVLQWCNYTVPNTDWWIPPYLEPVICKAENGYYKYEAVFGIRAAPSAPTFECGKSWEVGYLQITGKSNMREHDDDVDSLFCQDCCLAVHGLQFILHDHLSDGRRELYQE